MSTSSTKSERVARAGFIGAVVGALAASACCILPAVLAIVGISGVGIAAALEPYRPILLGGTAVLLAIGFYFTYRRPRRAAEAQTGDACGCEVPKVARTGKTMLWMATGLVVLFAAYPHVAGAFTGSSARGTATAANTASARIKIEGMTCESCTSHIVGVLAKLDGVVEATVDFEGGYATITYDPARVQPAQLATAIADLGYSTSVLPEG